MTAKEFISKLNRPLSITYLCKIENHNEIPGPEVIINMAEVLEEHPSDLLAIARIQKEEDYNKKLEGVYRRALEEYRNAT